MVHTCMHAYIYIVLNCLISFPVHAHYGYKLCYYVHVFMDMHIIIHVCCLHASIIMCK